MFILMKKSKYDEVRNRSFGFIFRDFHNINISTVLVNVNFRKKIIVNANITRKWFGKNIHLPRISW